MNVLLTCVGRRNTLVRFFQEALGGRGRVIAVDARGDAPALADADAAVVVPPITDPAYLETLVELCRRCAVGLLVPLNDFELPLLAAQQGRFLAVGTRPLVSSPSVVATCWDKAATIAFLRRHGFAAARAYTSLGRARQALTRQELAFPLVIKPRLGSGSVGIERVEDDHELGLAYALQLARANRARSLNSDGAGDDDGPLLIQERLVGQEYGLDIVNDLDGRHAATFVRRKLLMRAGETDRAVMVRHPALEQLGQQLGRALGHVGNLDCDVFVTARGCYVIDMNPRFGGGYPFSHAAGARLPSALLAWASGEPVDPRWLVIAPGQVAAKFDTVAVVEPALAAASPRP